MSLALIDADVIAYRAAVKGQADIDWGDGEEGLTVDTGAAIDTAHRMVETWTRDAEADDVLLCFSPEGGGNFRRDVVLDSYKLGRPEKPQPYWPVVESLEAEYDTERIPMLEADDVMGIYATHSKWAEDSVIVTIDKDLMGIPGWFFNPDKMKRPKRIRQLTADKFWMKQTLTGDPVDGFKGCPRIGEKRSTEMLRDATNMKQLWKRVRQAFINAGLDEEEAITQARLARILRAEDYDEEGEQIYLWHPKPSKKLSVTIV